MATEALPQARESLIDIIWPMVRALLWGAIGFVAGALVTAIVTGTGFTGEVPLTVGFIAGLLAWLLGGGAWEGAVKPWFGAEERWDQGEGISRYFRFNTDHKVIGLQYIWFSLIALFIAGIIAMLMRINLLTPAQSFFANAGQYNQFMSIHGTLMIFSVAVVTIVGGFGNYFVPLMVGAEDMTYPKLNGISWWFVPPGVFAILLSPLVGGIQTGWTGYAPLAAQAPSGEVLYYLGVFCLGISSLFSAINVIATTVWMRAPGLKWGRLPMFSWAMLATSFLALIWLPVVGTGMMMGLFDRLIPTNFFSASGDPLLWQDLFWTFAHPEVYIIILAPWALWLEIIPVMARKTLAARKWAVGGIIGVTFLSAMVWSHHMFAATSFARHIPFMATTELISIPSGFIFIAAIATLWKGRIRLNTPMLLILFSMFNFLIGGTSGIFLADVPSDLQLQDTFFVVGHFHYTIVGGMIFALGAALFYWFPKMTGRMYNERWGKIGAWMSLVAFNLTFFPMFISGIAGMNRRIATYLPYLQDVNVIISIGAWLFGVALILMTVNLLSSAKNGPRVGPNPWGAKTLEWQTSSPPPHHNFETEPIVKSDFYTYGALAAEGRSESESSADPHEGGQR